MTFLRAVVKVDKFVQTFCKLHIHNPSVSEAA